MQHFLATDYRTSINGSIDSLVVTRLVIERSWVRVVEGAFSPGSTFCADSYFGIHSTHVTMWHIKDSSHAANMQ